MENAMKKSFILLISIVILGCSGIVAQIQKSHLENKCDLVLNIKNSRLVNNSWSFDIELQNSSENSIYIATNPQQLIGTKGEYIAFDESQTKVLVSVRVYPRPLINPYSDETRVELKELNSKEVYKTTVSLNVPLKQTEPPHKDRSNNKELNDLNKIKKIIFSYGYFESDEGIENFLKLKPFGWFIKGYEKLLSGKNEGKSFLEIQKIATAEFTVQNSE